MEKHPENIAFPGKKQPLEKLWNRDYCIAMAGNFLLFFSFYLLTPLLPIYLDAQFGADKDMIGLVLSGYVIAALIVRPFSGFIVDSFNRKKVLVTCFFFFFICFKSSSFSGSLISRRQSIPSPVMITAYGFTYPYAASSFPQR